MTRLGRILGPWPERVPLDLEVSEETGCDGYLRRRIVFDTEDTMSVPAYLLVPEGRTAPGSAVLAVHGHGPGKSLVCGLEPEGAPGSDYAAELARRGHVVLAPDLRCFGERADWNPPDHYGCDTNLVHQVMGGWNPLTQNLWDLARCLDVLEGQPVGRPGTHRHGRLLLRGDGHPVPRRTRRTGAGGRGVRLPLVVGRGPQGPVEHVRFPGPLRHARPDGARRRGRPDRPARPSWRSTGRDDLLFPVAAFEESVARLRPVYEHFGAGDRLDQDIFDGEHQWYGAQAYPFLDRWLADGSAGG